MESERKSNDVIYVCAKCGKEFYREEMRLLPDPEYQRTQCPYCGYKIVYKKRSAVYKKIKAV
ncbi:MAG: DNA-directed RNA polymerase subunit P [Thermoprotei archaeon]|nr:MAG: DNA-directed RNA polymerase subunit P [Thermoprotei archaeon]